MPLIKSLLKNNIQELNDQEFPGFLGFPETTLEAATRWAEGIAEYATPIIPATTTILAAQEVLKNQLLTISNEASNGITVFQQALSDFASVISTGMQPTFTGTPPAIPLSISPATAIGFAGGTAEEVAEALSTIIDTWMKTGLAVNNSTGATINWN